MKKRILLTAALALVILIIASACSGGGDQGSADSNADSNAAANFSKFQSEDLNGKTVDGSIFAKADLTVLNIWGTFCSPCIKEMPDLGKLSREYSGKGIQIVGIPVDATSEKTIKDAKKIVASTKADYLHILPSEDLGDIYLNQVSAVPETLFVDKNGGVIGNSVGAHSEDEWKDLIDNAYKQVKQDDK